MLRTVQLCIPLGRGNRGHTWKSAMLDLVLHNREIRNVKESDDLKLKS
jgi:hypothetical protein